MANRFDIIKKSWSRYFDPLFILILMLIIVFGLVMLYSASSYDAAVNYNDAFYYLKKQTFATAVGLLLMLVVALIPYQLWERTRTFFYAGAVIMLLLIIPFGTTVNGAKRWLRFAGLSIQPAEIAKLAVIIVLAHTLVVMGPAINSWKGLFRAMMVSLPLAAMIYFITRNLSSAIIVVGIAAIMCFMASRDYKRYVLLLIAALAGAGLLVLVIVRSAGSGIGGFRGERVLAWLDPAAYSSGKGYQTIQALYAIGSGGIMGKGIGQSMQKLGFIPEAQNDMIFSIICEELGFVGAVCVIALFLLLLWRCIMIATQAPDLYGSYLVIGFMSHIAIQVILNIAVVTNTIPNTGISLPFISYGGSATFFLLFEVGLVLSVQRSIKIREH